MPARAKYNARRIDIRLDEDTSSALKRLVEMTGLTESKVIRKLIKEADRAKNNPKFTKP